MAILLLIFFISHLFSFFLQLQSENGKLCSFSGGGEFVFGCAVLNSFKRTGKLPKISKVKVEKE